ncbi:MAG: FAD:protein FMN transferase [Marinilabiliaceae bacterium]|nr:FAD:protein FMN transferase [Marinilabiliaceae bacterium]
MKVYSHSFWAMNTRFVMVIPDMSQEDGDELSKSIQTIVEKWENRLSRFREGAELRRINAMAYEGTISVSTDMATVIDACDQYHRLTASLFDPAVASIYDVMKCSENIAERDLEVQKAAGGWKYVEWDKNNRTIHFSSPEIILDMGGIGKGVALKEVVALLTSKSVRNAFLSFGESSIAGIGKHPYGDGWPVGVHNYQDSDAQASTCLLCDEFVSISGLQNSQDNTENGATAHIYHPLKGRLVNHSCNVMVKCQCPVQAEVLSTSMYMADEIEMQKLTKTFPFVHRFCSS